MPKRQLTLPAFPNSQSSPFEVTSEATGNYNCIAWAVGEINTNYWPSPEAFFAWPPEIPRMEDLASFVLFFQKFGFELCGDSVYEAGFEKLAIFSNQNLPTHAARQLPDGKWTSKLGKLEDVRHTLENISGGLYGEVAVMMKRPLNDLL